MANHLWGPRGTQHGSFRRRRLPLQANTSLLRRLPRQNTLPPGRTQHPSTQVRRRRRKMDSSRVSRLLHRKPQTTRSRRKLQTPRHSHVQDAQSHLQSAHLHHRTHTSLQRKQHGVPQRLHRTHSAHGWLPQVHRVHTRTRHRRLLPLQRQRKNHRQTKGARTQPNDDPPSHGRQHRAVGDLLQVRRRTQGRHAVHHSVRARRTAHGTLLQTQPGNLRLDTPTTPAGTRTRHPRCRGRNLLSHGHRGTQGTQGGWRTCL